MALPGPDSPFGKPIQPQLSKEMMDAMMRLPAPLEALVEGKQGPVQVSPEQLAEALQNSLFILMRHVPNVAAKLDVLYGAVFQLEQRVEKLEKRLARGDA